ncbi:right-handed parallel beta-helix repeat-containing protein, partial [Klebsiella aerogenes]|uniref:right-handed parallel beta-helix repeat-containing protein n=1 Tax=Klebsiella aerogenes TaxID=548 RepID=UPI002FFC0714
KRAYCLKTQPATGETYPKSDLFNKATSNSRVTIYIPSGVYFLSSLSGRNVSGSYCLLIPSNIIIQGEGTLKLLPRQYGEGAFFRILASDITKRISNVDIIGVTLDGNSSSQVSGVQASNILLEASDNIKISNVKSINANGNGILIRGGGYGKAVKNVTITNCDVIHCSKIGIQVSQFDGLLIENNRVSFCNDNGIDVYGDAGREDINKTNGNNFSILNNYVDSCLNGVFPETVSNGNVRNNTLTRMKDSGIHINRIHNLPQNINVENNTISNSNYGVFLTGDMKNIVIKNNTISKIKVACFSFGSDNGVSSGVSVVNNKITITQGDGYLSLFSGLRINNVVVSDNTLNIKGVSSLNSLVKKNAKAIDNRTVIVK